MMIFNQSISVNPGIDLILPFRKGGIKKNQIKEITQIETPDFEGDFSEIQTLHNATGHRIYLLGLGEEKDAPNLREAFRKFYFKTEKYWSEIQLDCRGLKKSDVTQAVLGFEMATYEIGVYKSAVNNKNEKHHNVSLISEQDLSNMLTEGKRTGETINRIKTLVDAPPNHKTPSYLADWTVKSASTFGYHCEILDKNILEKEGFGALLGVGRGSIHPPVLIVTKHTPKKGNIDIALVGKGITFDTGGLSIKPSQNLHFMKSDMGGAAVVLGAVELAAKLQLEVNIVGVVAAAENAVDANSIRPGDVIDSYSGKTIEIIDTDAEGRLVLADALSYVIKKHQPDQVIDLATLTGSVPPLESGAPDASRGRPGRSTSSSSISATMSPAVANPRSSIR